jgi:hypothetical protein
MLISREDEGTNFKSDGRRTRTSTTSENAAVTDGTDALGEKFKVGLLLGQAEEEGRAGVEIEIFDDGFFAGLLMGV